MLEFTVLKFLSTFKVLRKQAIYNTLLLSCTGEKNGSPSKLRFFQSVKKGSPNSDFSLDYSVASDLQYDINHWNDLSHVLERQYKLSKDFESAPYIF